MKYSFKPYCSYFLFFFLCACGVKGPLFLPPPSPTPSKPGAEEPIGKLYPIDKSSINRFSLKPIENNSSKPTSASSDSTSTTPSIKN